MKFDVVIGNPPIVILNETKQQDYYPLFRRYHQDWDIKGFANLIGNRLITAIESRLGLLEGEAQ